VMEQQARDKARYTQESAGRDRSAYTLTGFRAAGATLCCCLVLTIAFLVPFGQLLVWMLDAGFGELDERYLGFLGHTLGLGAIAGLVAVAVALLLAFVKRLPGGPLDRRWMAISVRLATLGYALPGSVLAVGIMLGFTIMDRGIALVITEVLHSSGRLVLTGSVFALVLAYCCRFLAVAYAPVESGLEQIKPSVIEAARSLGATPGRLLARIYIPLLRPGLITAFTIVFVDVMKEMPATLIMRPFGWETLAVQIYQMTAEGQWERAALPAVTLIAIGLVPVYLLIRSARRTKVAE